MAEIRVNATGAVKLYDNDDSHFVGLQAGSISSDVTFTLPTADGSNGQFIKTNGSGALSFGSVSSALDDITTGDAASTLATSAGNITIDAQGSDTDIIFKGTDGGADTTFLTIDGSDAGTLIANHNLELGTDSSEILFGADNEVKIIHNADKGLILKHTATADDKPVILTLQTGETDMAANDVMGKIEFQAPDESTGTDAILVAAAIQAVSEGDFSSSSNATRLEFMTGSSEAATSQMTVSSGGIVGIGAGVPGDLGVGLHIKTADASASTHTSVDELVLENNGHCGLHIISANDATGNIYWGDDGAVARGYLQYNHDGDELAVGVAGATALNITSSTFVINDGGADVDFRVESDSQPNMLNLQGAHASNSAGTIGFNSTNSDGNFLEAINPSANVYTMKFDNSAGSGNLYCLNLQFSGQAPDDNTSYFISAADSSAGRFHVLADGDVRNADNSYGSISDERVKEQIKDSTSQWDDIKAVKVKKYKMKQDIVDKGDSDSLWRLGVIAQDLEAAGMHGLVKAETTYKEGDQETKDHLYTEKDKNTGAIPEGKDVGDIAIAKKGNVGDIKDYKSVKYSILYMKAIKALQEAQTRIETLETKVAALEG